MQSNSSLRSKLSFMRKKIEQMKESELHQNAYQTLGPQMVQFLMEDLQQSQFQNPEVTQFLLQPEATTCFEVKRLLEFVQKGMIAKRRHPVVVKDSCKFHLASPHRRVVSNKVFVTRKNINNKFDADISEDQPDSFDSAISSSQLDLDRQFALLKNIEDTLKVYERGGTISHKLLALLGVERGYANIREELSRISQNVRRKIKHIMRAKQKED